MSHEFSITINNPLGSGYINVPGIVPGQLSFDPSNPKSFGREHFGIATKFWNDIFRLVGETPVPVYPTVDDAVAVARKKSAEVGLPWLSSEKQQAVPEISSPPAYQTLLNQIFMGVP